MTFLLLPILVPFLTAVITMLFWHDRTIQRRINVVGGVALQVVVKSGQIGEAEVGRVVRGEQGGRGLGDPL